MHELRRAEKRGHCVLGKPKSAHYELATYTLLLGIFLCLLLKSSVLVY